MTATLRSGGVRREIGTPRTAVTMGYQPALDGLRAVSVIAVLLYHAGFSWMHGGFFGVEVFFVVSGFLITSLLLDERERDGGVSFRQFWIRRARRLFPALVAVLVAVALWTAVLGSDEQRSQIRRELPWSIFYVNNWGQILGNVPYFAGEPSMFRHLWSLAVEEQWYVVWPLVFVALIRLDVGRDPAAERRIGIGVLAAAFVVFGFMHWVSRAMPTPLGGPPGVFDGVDRTNFMYLSTLTRAGGLLLGAGAAFVWRPWRSPRAVDAPAGKVLDPLGAAAVAMLGCVAAVAVLTEPYIYRWLLPLVSILSLVAVMVAVHPAAVGFRRAMSWTPLVEIGKRSYGLYLWSWPIFVAVGAFRGEVWRFVVAMAISVVVAEASYRYLETPIRHGSLGRWWNQASPAAGYRAIGGALGVVVVIGLFYANVGEFNRFAGGADAEFDAGAVTGGVDGGSDAHIDDDDAAAAGDPSAGAPGGDSTDGSVAVGAVAPVDTIDPVVPATSARVAIVGDSQANALAINLPDGIEGVFPKVVNGSVDGCSVYDSGGVRSAVAFRNSFSICQGWQGKWATAAAGNDVALVVVGAWDVFDMVDGDTTYTFASPAADEYFAENLRSGIDAMLAEGVNVGLLEVACMRPQDVRGAGVRALPERGDDTRVAHVNDLLRSVAASYGTGPTAPVQFVEGPTEWCHDEAIASDLGYRWDGVHVYKPGANLIYQTVAPALLRLAAV